MGPKLTMFLMLTFFLGTFVSLLIEGAWYGTEDVSLLNHMTGYSVMQISGSGFWGVAKMGIGFLTTGLPTVLLWNYSYLEGDWEILRWFLVCTISVGVIWGVAQVFLSPLQGVFQRFF